MRVTAVCLAFALAVLTALPDTNGAPASDVALASGSKEFSSSSKKSQCDEEQEHLTQEQSTQTGTSTVDHSVKKKISVTTSEQKNVLFYYVVSYKRLPKQRPSETTDEYYRRLFPKEDNLKVLYRRVFKLYEGENSQSYIERIEYIWTHIYPKFDCRLDLDWLEQFDHYYTVKYCRNWGETDCDYYARILKKKDEECDETYKKRMECLVAALDEEDFSHISFIGGEPGYTVGERKTPCTSVSTPTSTAEVTGTRSTTVKSTSSEVDVDASVTSIESESDCGSASTVQKKVNKQETTVEKETTTTTSSYKVAYMKLPDKTPGESDEKYYKSFFGTFDDNASNDQLNEMYLRCFLLYMHESTDHYLKRIDYMFNNVYHQFDIRFDKNRLPITAYYHRLKYERIEDETECEWFHRVLLKEQDECAEHYMRRVEILQEVFKNVNWSHVYIDKNSYTGYTFVSEAESLYSESSLDSTQSTIYIQRGVKEDVDEDEIKNTYAKKDYEDYSTYYQRLTAISNETTEEYIEKLTSIRKCFAGLDLWYDLQYLDYIKEYYSKLFAKLSCETYEQHIERITKKYSFETDIQCAKRIGMLQLIYPGLDLWCEEQYFEKYTKEIYHSLYISSEESDQCLYERITKPLPSESDSAYVKRLGLIKLTHHSLDLWYDKTYLNLTSKYFTLKYTQGTTEKITSFYERIVKKEMEETDEQCARRAELVRYLHPNLPLWCEEKYYELYTGPLYALIYSKKVEEKEVPYYQRITEKSYGEAEGTFINRMSLVKRTFNSLPLWYSSDYVYLTTSYYTARYAKLSTEVLDDYYKRIVEKEAFETDEQCAYRVAIIHSHYPTLALWHELKYYETLTHKTFEIIYSKRTNEDKETHFSRIVSQIPGETDMIYIERMGLVKRATNYLSIWYDTSYSDLTSKYYIAKYKKGEYEEWDDVYERIVTKEFDETDEQCAHRVEVARYFYPDLSLWSLETYFEKFIKKHYSIIFRKSSNEDERNYYARICTRFPKESDHTYVGRLYLVQKTLPTLSLWYDSAYIDLISDYIKTKYVQDSNECEEAYAARVVAKMDCDINNLIYSKRIHMIHLLTASSPLWCSDLFYDPYFKPYYSNYYAKGEDECCETWLERVITRLDGECDDDAIKRIAFIKKSTSECGCWTVETLNNIKSNFTSEYYEKIKDLFFITDYSETTSVSSSSSTSESEDSSKEIVITRG